MLLIYTNKGLITIITNCLLVYYDSLGIMVFYAD